MIGDGGKGWTVEAAAAKRGRTRRLSAQDGLRLAARAVAVAEARHRPAEMCLSLTRLGRSYRELGAHAPAERTLEQALRWAHALGAADPVIELLCELADAASASADELRHADQEQWQLAQERALQHARDAVHQAGAASDPHWEVRVLLRMSDLFDHLGEHGDAMRLQARALQMIGHAAP